MSENKLDYSASSRETGIYTTSSRTSSVSEVKAKFCALFLNCFRGRKKDSLEEIRENDGTREYDYVVEKLVVKRVPFLLFSIPKHPSESKNNSESKSDPSNETSQFLIKPNPVQPVLSETQSLLYYSNKFNQHTPLGIRNKYLHYNKNAAVLNKRSRNRALSDDYHARMTELMNIMSSLHPDLKEDERPPKDPCPLTMPKSNSIPSAKISLKEFLYRSNDNQNHKVFKSQLFVKEPENENSLETKSNNNQNVYKLNQLAYTNFDNFKIREASAQSAQKLSCNFTDYPKTIKGTNQIQIEDNDCIHNNHESNVLSENISDTNPSSTIIRWNIIVKYSKFEPNTTETPQTIRNYFTIT
ncbi:uncharacterized protein LOC108627752 [Ceratina calcarata]|uniref:Uncharacterized protein LOC108627752 n=1 Tax=Ceratina calcarata TaxID=156304 RepID=A0AAJ7J5K1_9HYME|nr:uncharacterized protein LOC108627752 [Ceratina calcarata]